MYLSYIDESSDKINYYVTSMTIQDSDIKYLDAALENVMIDAELKYGIPSATELHGYSLTQGVNGWALLKNEYEARKSIYKSALEVIASVDLKIYIRGVPIDYYTQKYSREVVDIHRAALAWNLERVQNYVRIKQSEVLLIADSMDNDEDELRSSVRRFQTTGTFGYKGLVLDRVIDTLHFCPAKASRLLQASDLLSYAFHRSLRTYGNPLLTDFHKELWKIPSNLGRIGEATIWLAPVVTTSALT